jgi:hypothetical protein
MLKLSPSWEGKKTFEKKKLSTLGLSVVNMQKNFWFTSNFEHWKFASNGAYLKNK